MGEPAVAWGDQAVADFSTDDHRRHLRMLEAMLFATSEPLSRSEIALRMPEGVYLEALLAELQTVYSERGVNLRRSDDRWAFRTAEDLAFVLKREVVEQKKLSRAAVETLAVIAYHQPATRAEIEDVRGVAVSPGTLDVLLEAGWIRLRGRRRTPGRPVTFGTTPAFLDHFGLESIGDLPGLADLRAAGLIEALGGPSEDTPEPNDNPELHDNENPLEPDFADLAQALDPGQPEERVEEPGLGEEEPSEDEAELAAERR